jgi:hypothetical protein
MQFYVHIVARSRYRLRAFLHVFDIKILLALALCLARNMRYFRIPGDEDA